MNTAEILTEKLQLFINELRLAGYNIGLTQFVAAQNLILALAKQGELSPKLASLKTLLAPVLCHSPKEQTEFGRRFENWVKQVEASEEVMRGPTKEVILEKPAPKTVSPSKLKKWAYFGIGVVLIASFVFYQFIFTEPETSPIKTPSTTETPSTSAKQPDAPTPSDDKPDDFSLETITLLESPVNFLWMLLLLLALILILVWHLWKKVRDALTQFYLKRELTSRRPELQRLSVKASTLEKSIFQPISLSRSAQQLRKHSAIEDNTLDITATLEKTIEAGGWPTPVYGSRPHLPEYLVLIDRTTFKDHQAKLVNTLLNQLVKEGVFIIRSYFDGNPRQCYLESDADPFVPLTLTELAERYPDHRLLIFSDGQGLINAVTGELVNWIDQFAVWTLRILLTLEAPEQWGYRKTLLEQADFLVLPANETGLQWLVEQLNAGTPESYRTSSEAEYSEFPQFLNDYPRRWLERHAPEPTELLELLKQVRFFLGKAGYYWFSACAVYPELHWELTLYLGDKLTSDGKKLLTEEHLAKLARLPWFRSGYMPEWLRERLVEDLLAAKKDKAIREAIDEFLQPKPEEASKTAHVEVAVGQPSIDEGEPLREYVFVGFMADKLLLKVSKRLQYLLIGKIKNKAKRDDINMNQQSINIKDEEMTQLPQGNSTIALQNVNNQSEERSDISEIQAIINRIDIVKGDIAKQYVDAIVNTTDHRFSGDGGVDYAIHWTAGPELKEACLQLNRCATGDAKITKGYKLPAQFVIHTVGPVWEGGKRGESDILAQCYYNCLALTEQYSIQTIAFPAISTGTFGFPLELASKIAVYEVSRFLIKNTSFKKVILVCFTQYAYNCFQTTLEVFKRYNTLDSAFVALNGDIKINKYNNVVKYAILWVDDRPENNRYQTAILFKIGIEVVIAKSTSEALRLFQSQKFGWVISDMTRFENEQYNTNAGIELIKEIRKINKTIPIIIYTDNRQAETKHHEAILAGATAITSDILFDELGLNTSVSQLSKTKSIPIWLIGTWIGNWNWHGQNRDAKLIIDANNPEMTAMIIRYEKSDVETILEQQLQVEIMDDEVHLTGMGYKFIEKGNAIGWHLDIFKLKVNPKKDRLDGIIFDKRLAEVEVHFIREDVKDNNNNAD
jgi:O-acetyl-ADP-ribose deacetylase (regulator of RNase III)